MAIYHLNVGHVSRTTGRSSVQSAAYITGEKLFESRRELKVSYNNRQSDIVASQTLAPDHAPDNCRELAVWDRLESYEDEYAIKRFPNDEKSRHDYMNSARTAMTVVVALPKELTLSVSQELVEQFAKERFVSRGLIVTYAVHDDEGNPHAHLQVSRRSVNADGTFSWAKDRAICTRSGIRETRSVWAELANQMLEREGFEARITEKSFADLGIDLEPTEHRGWVADKLKEKNVVSRIVQENTEVFERNRERLIQNPELILDELTVHNATLTQRAILQGLQKRLGDNAEVVARCFEQALGKAVYLGQDMDGLKRYTSKAYLKAEQDMLNLVRQLAEKAQGHPVSLSATFAGSMEQQAGAEGLLQGHALSVLIGRAGSGKTTTLKAVAESYQQAGFKVVGASLSALATENLGREAGIEAHTVASWLYRWHRYEAAQEKFLSFDSIVTEGVLKQKDWYRDLKVFDPFQLTDKHVLIIDEAGMLGTRQWKELLERVHRTGARVIAVGDDHQFTPIEGGFPLPKLRSSCEKSGTCYQLSTIHRQREEWMRQASRHFAELETGDGLAMYEQRGRIHATDKAHLSRDIAVRYLEISLKEGGNPLVLAYTNEQVNELNDAIRQLRGLRPFGDPHFLGKDVFHINGRGMAIGDVVVLTKNDPKITEGGVYNGMRGVIRGYEKGVVTIETSDGTQSPNGTKSFNIKDYNHIQHGYAVTLHKSQGQTVDRVLVAVSSNGATSGMDAKAVYVEMTRHRYDAELYYAKEDFKDFKTLVNRLSRFENKEMAQDYTIRTENYESWQRVQAYREAVLDGAASLKQGDKDGYWEARSIQVTLGKEILRETKHHQLYLHQAGFTEDMLKISTGMKRRIPSLSEQRAQITVELYAEVAKEVRLAWKEKVPSRSDYQEIRGERDSLARVILENVPLHRPFFKENNVQLKTLQNQVAYRERVEQARLEQDREKQRVEQNDASVHSTAKEMEKPPQSGSDRHIEKSQESRHQGALNQDSSHRNSPNQSLPKSSQQEKITKLVARYNRSSHEVITGLDDRIKDLAYHLMGEPTHRTNREWRYGHRGSVSIIVSGARQGLYSDFETGSSGHAVQLIADQLKISRMEAFKWGAEWLGNNITYETVQKKQAEKGDQRSWRGVETRSVWVTVKPKDVVPDLRSEPQLAAMMMGRHEVARYAYRDEKGELLGYVVRLEDKDGNKITPMLAYGHDVTEEKASTRTGKKVPPRSGRSPHCGWSPYYGWRFRGFTADGEKRPLYGLDVLSARSIEKVLVVEGEKTCEAARTLFPDHVVVTWSGGCGAVAKSDWSVLKGRDVTLWPDHDQPGRQAMNKVEDILKEVGATSVKQVDIPSTFPHKWDLADKAPDGVNPKDLRSLLGDREEISREFCAAVDRVVEQGKLYSVLYDDREKAYRDVQNFYQQFKELSAASGSDIPSDAWHLKRATYAVYHMKEYLLYEKNSLSDEERFRHTLVASTMFAHTGDRDVHFKAVGIVRSHDRTGMDDEKAFKETFGVMPLRDRDDVRKDYAVLQEPLRHQMLSFRLECQREHESLERSKELSRGKDLDLSR